MCMFCDDDTKVNSLKSDINQLEREIREKDEYIETLEKKCGIKKPKVKIQMSHAHNPNIPFSFFKFF